MPLPDWLRPLPDAEQMRASDARAIEREGIPGPQLMERAGGHLARRVPAGGRVVIACGGGNNGGDGYVAARLLRDTGREVDVRFTSDPDRLRGDALQAFEHLEGPAPQPWDDRALDGAAVVVDCLLGTGFGGGAPREDVAGAIRAINACSARVVACDIASGVDASTGEVPGEAVCADATVTFHADMPGHWIAPGKAHAGRLHVADIGLPATEGDPRIGLLHPGVLAELPRRAAEGTKFSSGHVLVAGGSRGLTGAVTLAAMGAMRAGAGYVTACIPAELEPIMEIKLTEAMTLGLDDAPADAVLEKAARGGALVLGPGLGRERDAVLFARDLAARAELPLVLDADGLNAHAGRLGDLRQRTRPTVLTPHGGELARLLEADGDDVRARRLHHARRAAEAAGAIVLLKGDDTLVCAPDGRVAVSPGGAPALATAGTGDVLSGVLGAFLARGTDPFTAACAAVRVHLEAGRRAAARLSVEGVIAGDVAQDVALVLRG
ncbi:MAG TPA: NAD(P)H-hydrate dehydratase [Baekduia sp.]|nr:NAD(P)H-hydrate dehydratase [Baekduia sp.]